MFQAEDKLCHCLLQLGDHEKSIEHCSAALKTRTEVRILCDRAEAYIGLDMLDEAQQDYSKVRFLCVPFSLRISSYSRGFFSLGFRDRGSKPPCQRRFTARSEATETGQETRLLQDPEC